MADAPAGFARPQHLVETDWVAAHLSLERHVWSKVTLRLTDGRTLQIGPRQVPGHPGTPLTLGALRDKFNGCAALVLPEDRVASVREMVEVLDGCPDLRSLTAILSPAR